MTETREAGRLLALGRRACFARRGGLVVIVAFLLTLAPTTAQAATQTREDPSDAPTGVSGKADLRKVAWDVGGTFATLTVDVDASTYGAGTRAPIGVNVLLDTDGDGIADHEIVATRNADGVTVDVALRHLDRTLSSADCQDLAGMLAAAQAAVPTSVANGVETFTFSFDPILVPGSLAAFRWAAFGQAPPDSAGPWDVMPDAANPDPAAANPGDRRCGAGKTGLSVRMSEGVAFPDAGPEPTPPSAATPTPAPDITKPSLSALSLSRTRFRAAGSGPSIATAVGTKVSYVLSEAAAVRFRIERALPGRRVGGHCVRATRSNRRAKRCTRHKTVRGSFIHQGHMGSNRFIFRGRLRGRRLKPGRYRLRGVATDPASNKSRLKQSEFQVVSR